MTRLVPHPLLSAGLLAMWLLLNGASAGHLVLGAVIALVGGRALAAVEPERVRLRNPRAILRLLAVVAGDILRSNLAVATLIVTDGRHGQRTSAFVAVPLRLRAPAPLAVLAVVVTATPGTAWVEFDPETGILLLHVFDMVDEEEWRSLIRDRYEALLLEIFP